MKNKTRQAPREPSLAHVRAKSPGCLLPYDGCEAGCYLCRPATCVDTPKAGTECLRRAREAREARIQARMTREWAVIQEKFAIFAENQ